MIVSASLLLLLLLPQQAQASPDLVCKSAQDRADLMQCKTKLLQFAGHNFTADCEDGIVEDFMRCVDAIKGCEGIAGFAERSFYDYYGCTDTEIMLHKRSWVCRAVCYFSCGYGELHR